MRRHPEVLVSDPVKRVFESPARKVTLGGVWGKALPDAGRFMGLPPEEALRLLEGYERDGIAVLAEKDTEGNLAEIYAYRGPSTGCELFFSSGPGNRFVLSDSFREILETLPPSSRLLSREGFIDFLLFQSSPLPETPIGSIRRLGHGNLLQAGRDGSVTERPFQRLSAGRPAGTFREGIEGVEGALSKALGLLPAGTVNLLSGGVDSTLVQAILGPGHRAAAATIDSPEFAFETENAKYSARLCGVPLEKHPVRESDFLSLVESETALSAVPLPLPQVAVIAAAFGLEADIFSSGFDADSVFSLPRSKRRFVLEGANPQSFEAGSFSLSPEAGLLETLFGKEEIADRVERRQAYVRSRVSEPELLPELELGCLTSLYCSSFAVYRHLAAERGKGLFTPFMDREVVEAALRVPLPERVFRNGVFKPVLKDILSRRLPGFHTDIEKGGSGLPRTRLCKEGPLKGYFRENALPSFIDPEKADPVLNPDWGSSMTAYRCIAWSAWEKTLVSIPWEGKRWG